MSSATQRLHRGRKTFVECYKYDIIKLPEPGIEWTVTEQEILEDVRCVDMDRHVLLNNLIAKRIINKVGWTKVEGGGKVRLYQTREKPYNYARDVVDSADGPIRGCEHSGVRNLRDGPYSCSYDDCDNTAPREHVDWD